MRMQSQWKSLTKKPKNYTRDTRSGRTGKTMSEIIAVLIGALLYEVVKEAVSRRIDAEKTRKLQRTADKILIDIMHGGERKDDAR